MISLGITNIRTSRELYIPTATSSVLTSPEVLLALAEAATWCSRARYASDKLRSSLLDPSGSLQVPPFEQLGIDAYLVEKRNSYQRATASVTRQRSELLLKSAVNNFTAQAAQATGKLLLYEPMETVSDGASASESCNLFDIEDAPPWDTWFCCAEQTILCLVPDFLIANVEAGINANPVDCIHWADWSKLAQLTSC